MAEKHTFFLSKILELVTGRIKAKVIFFEIFLILFVALSIGVTVNFYMQDTLTRKAHSFCERIARDLANSVQNNYISLSAADESVKSFTGTEGILYLGYHGRVVTTSMKVETPAPTPKPVPTARRTRTSRASTSKPAPVPTPMMVKGDPEVARVNLFMGTALDETTLSNIEGEIKGVTNFQHRKEVLNLKTAEGVLPAYQYFMPVQVKINDAKKKIGTVVLLYNRQIIDREILIMRIIIVLTTLVVIILSINLSVRGANTIVKPIVQLTGVVKRFGAGDLSAQARLKAHDEIGVLARSFNEMIMSVREKLEMQKFVSDSTVRMIQKSVNDGHTASEKEKHTERKEVTLFFSDIRGFTSMSEKLDPQDVIDILNEYLDVQTNIIHDCGGDIDKFVGDEIVAVFEHDAMYDNAVQAACQAQKKIGELNEERKMRGLAPVEVGIGINSGEVVMGSVGSHDRMDFTVIGDNVNLASRLCSAAGKSEIIISQSVYEKIDPKAYQLVKLQPIQVKGKVKPIEVYRVEY